MQHIATYTYANMYIYIYMLPYAHVGKHSAKRSGDFLIFLSLKVGNDLFKVDGPGRVPTPWVRDPDLELRLFQGRIGIPLIDAAIRNLTVARWEIGG